MKKERFTFLILFVEIAAIIFLHSAKSKQAESGKLLGDKSAAANATYQLKAFTITKVK
jgi:hypothetical protein